MRFIQVSIAANDNEQEFLIAVLTELDTSGFEQTEEKLIAYFVENNFNEELVNNCLKKYNYKILIVPEQNWNQQWEKNFKPVIIEGFCAIRADFHPQVNNVTHEIIINPKMSFGTGHHPTTYMMINQMKEIDFVNKKVFDFGTGTGILAILAEKSGAKSVTAVDIDEWSIKNAIENTTRNKCFKIHIGQSDSIPGEVFEVILVNINKNIILQHFSGLTDVCSTNGKILMSGFLEQDENDIVTEMKKFFLNVINRQMENGWVSLLIGR